MDGPTGNQGPAFLDSWQLNEWPLRHSLLWEVPLGIHSEVSAPHSHPHPCTRQWSHPESQTTQQTLGKVGQWLVFGGQASSMQKLLHWQLTLRKFALAKGQQPLGWGQQKWGLQEVALSLSDRIIWLFLQQSGRRKRGQL